ncbi:MAG TPA: hypothetical protein DD407_12025 [Pseudohongiella sp.]|nr:hypothetical protein [Gammaproteobacteria bacterium]HBN15757.1 hypothetical protein [Pseudohongiella sp.]|tara:strand:- start:839 stop:1555 length:717 start_codon:yes stop_codon:yes gene_type:complete
MPNFRMLIDIATLCRDVYQHTPLTDKLGIIGMHDFSNGHDYGCAYISDDTIYFVVRGTDDRHDWRSNFKFVKRKEWYGIKAHRGFVQGAQSMQEDMLEVLEKYPELNVVFAGHSRGGAIALLLAIAAEFHYPGRSSRVITYGQPRVSTRAQIRQAYHGPYLRVENGSDIVCRYPKIGYNHGGTLLYITNRGYFKTNPGALTRFGDRLFTLRQRKSDHDLTDYIQELALCEIAQLSLSP